MMVPASAPATASYPTDKLLEKIRAALDSPNDADRDDLFTNLLPTLVRQDARAAAQLAESLDSGLLREEMLRHVAQTWAAQAADDAMAWAVQLPDSVERNSALGDVLLQLSQSDPGKAMALAGKYGTSDFDESGELRANLAQLWAEKDWPAAMTWTQANPVAGLQQDQIMERLAFVLAKTSPADAAKFATAQIPPGFVQIEAAMSVLHQWGLQDMAGARAWLMQFPEGEVRQRGERELDGIAAYANAATSNSDK